MPHPALPRRFLGVDAGSNTIKYRAWEINAGGECELLAEQRFPVRLGEGVFGGGSIAPAKIEAALRVFEQIRADADRLGIDELRAVTTSAMREAPNGAELVEAVMRRTGIALAVLPALEEARLIGLGAMGDRLEEGGAWLMLDIGGGSSEVILARRPDLFEIRSLRLGAVRLTERFFPALPPTPDQIEAARAFIDETLAAGLNLPAVEGPLQTIGSAGTITALAGLIEQIEPGVGGEEPLIERRHVEHVIAEAARLDAEGIHRLFKLEPQRSEIILAGALILDGLLRRLGQQRLRLVRGGVSDGLLRLYLEELGLRRPPGD